MTDEERHAGKVATILTILSAFNARDPETPLPLLTEDVVLDLGATAKLLGRTEPWIGHAGLAEYGPDMLRVWDELRITPRETDLAQADDGIVHVAGELTGRVGEAAFTSPARWRFVFRGERVCEITLLDVGA